MISSFLFLLLLISAYGESRTAIAQTQDFKQVLAFRGELDVVNKSDVFSPTLDESYWTLTANFVIQDGILVQKDQVIITFQEMDAKADLRKAARAHHLELKDLELKEFELEKEKQELLVQQKRHRINLKKAQTYLLEDEQHLLPRIEREKAKLEVQAATLELDQANKARDEFEKRAETAREVQKIKLEDAREELDKKLKNLESMEVKAPVTGIFYRPLVNLGNSKEKIQPGKSVSGGTKIAEIVNFEKFVSRIYAVQSDAISISPGDRVQLEITANPGEKLSGKVQEIEAFPISRKERLSDQGPGGALKEVEIKVELDQAFDWMRPGMSLMAIVSTTLEKNQLVIPLAAL